jgi:hypothetical protein
MSSTVTIKLSQDELDEVLEALDSLNYWQLGEENERRDGFVHFPESGTTEYRNGTDDERARWDRMEAVEQLAARLALLRRDE